MVDWSVIVANWVIIATAVVTVAMWTRSAWKLHQQVKATVLKVNGELAEAVQHLAAIRELLEQDETELRSARHATASVLGPLDAGPPQ